MFIYSTVTPLCTCLTTLRTMHNQPHALSHLTHVFIFCKKCTSSWKLSSSQFIKLRNSYHHLCFSDDYIHPKFILLQFTQNPNLCISANKFPTFSNFPIIVCSEISLPLRGGGPVHLHIIIWIWTTVLYLYGNKSELLLVGHF